jgi:hypothetical protein
MAGTLRSGRDLAGAERAPDTACGHRAQEQYIAPSVSEPSYGPPRLLLQLNMELLNGTTVSGDRMHTCACTRAGSAEPGGQITVVSDGSWTGRQGPVVLDSVYNGEMRDARLDRPGKAGAPVRFASGSLKAVPVCAQAGPRRASSTPFRSGCQWRQCRRPAGRLLRRLWNPSAFFRRSRRARAQRCAVWALTEGVWQPVNYQNVALNVYGERAPAVAIVMHVRVALRFVADFGQNFAGWCRVKLSVRELIERTRACGPHERP